MYKTKWRRYHDENRRPRGYTTGSFCLGNFHLSDKDRQLHRIFGRIYQKARLEDQRRIEHLKEEVGKIGGWGETEPGPESMLLLYDYELEAFKSDKNIYGSLGINEENEVISRMVERYKACPEFAEKLTGFKKAEIESELGLQSISKGKER